ncbi:AAA family ATPase [Nocardia stercoris]|uniref:ATP-binding protein n=1 Tax=Nocardia stercoris TaxID=2483361 RepID=A0A3M2KX65_9NOCA|nr:AAA family ATPase [Nocardia stercoris]RMI30132.1 ATP-binding protein [Nocardia stercoris]
MITTLAVENYRSLRRLTVPLTKLTLVTGANGSGKSSLYRSLRLLSETARSNAVAALAREGGLDSTLWAGPRVVGRRQARGNNLKIGQATDPVALRLGFSGDDFGYTIEFGLPMLDSTSMFSRDPEIKCESVWYGPILRPTTSLVERNNGVVSVRGEHGDWKMLPHMLRSYDSMLTELSDPATTPELFRVRDMIRSWRFYDHFRTDTGAAARGSHIGTRTPVLSGDGADLAAALRTIYENGDRNALAETIDRAFPGSRVEFAGTAGRVEILLHQPGLSRPLSVAELSDGTLRYLLLVAALLTLRPPQLLVLNEPESSLHPDLLAPLGALIADAAQRTQVIVVSHARQLVAATIDAAEEADIELSLIQLRKDDSGETLVDGQGFLDEPAWYWPKR